MAMSVTNLRMRQVVRSMREAGATSPETACELNALGLRPRLTHKQAIWYLKGRGALVEVAPDTYYLDTEAMIRYGKLDLKIFAGVMSALLVLVAVLVALGL